MQTGSIRQINISNGGVPKVPVERAEVGIDGIVGDRHRDTKNHGGSERALCLFSAEVIEALRAEGHPIAPGTVGENLTVSGLDWATVVPGKRYRAGEVELEITGYTSPCKNIAESFEDGEFIRISNKLHLNESRVYARVLKTGVIRPGDSITEMPS